MARPPPRQRGPAQHGSPSPPPKLDPGDVVGGVDTHLQCTICSYVLSQPRSCKGGHTFCKDCIEQWLRQKATCPLGCAEELRVEHLFPNLIAAGMVDALVVRCINAVVTQPARKKARSSRPDDEPQPPTAAQGCWWTGKLEAREHHCRECGFEWVMCVDCGEDYLRDAHAQHELGCEYRQVPCESEHCPLTVALADMPDHLDVCEGVEVDCPLECGGRFLRGATIDHLRVCGFMPIDCPFAPHVSVPAICRCL